MNVTQLNFSPLGCNCYLLGQEGSPCILFDCPPDEEGKLAAYVKKHHGYAAMVFLTHGHVDHVGGLEDLPLGPNSRVILSPEDEPCLSDARLNGSIDVFGDRFELERELPLYLCQDEDEIYVGEKDGVGLSVEVIATPFHTKGSVCYYLPQLGILFSGDTLFRFGVGRTDLPHASPKAMETSLKRLLTLPEDTQVYPGHGSKTTIGKEKNYNPFLSSIK